MENPKVLNSSQFALLVANCSHCAAWECAVRNCIAELPAILLAVFSMTSFPFLPSLFGFENVMWSLRSESGADVPIPTLTLLPSIREFEFDTMALAPIAVALVRLPTDTQALSPMAVL